jgi:hypothetical protein
MGEPPFQSEAIDALRFRNASEVATEMPQAPQLRALLDYWNSKCGADGSLPSRALIDPVELRGLLPHVYLVDVLPDESFRIRLLGEVHVAIYGTGLVGRSIDEIFPPEHAAQFHRLYKAVLRRRAPVVNAGQVFWWRNKEWLPFEGLHMPLAGDGRKIDMIFAGGVFGDIAN